MYTWYADARRYEIFRLDDQLEMRIYLWCGEWVREVHGGFEG